MVDISFDTVKLAKLCNSEKKLRGEYGDRMAKVIMRRLQDLAAVESLETMRQLPGRCHELTSNLKGLFAMDLVHPDRLAFRPDHEPVPTGKGNETLWNKVTAIEVVGIGDYH